MNKFDDIFGRKAKEAFDNYNADHLAEEGWNAFVSKHGSRRSRKIFFPLWARAASIIILVTAGVLFINRLNNREAGETVGQLAQDTRSEQSGQGKSEIDSGSVTAVTAQSQPEITAVAAERTETYPEIRGNITETGPNELVTAAVTPLITGPEQASLPEAGSYQTAPAVSAALLISSNPIEIRLADAADATMTLNPRNKSVKYADLPREKLETTIMTGLSGMIAGIGDATPASQGVSIGFYVEQQLTPRISVRPGLAMARHNYALESTTGGSTALDYAAPEMNGIQGTITSYDADIDVVSMEVPVNFIFSLRKRSRSDLFVSAGASTVVYLSQHLSGNFNNTYARATVDSYGEVSYEYMTTSVEIEREQELLNHVDLLGLANFSAGYSFPFAGTSRLLFEPFVQLPIRDLTSMNLRIRYGGLSMKLKF